MKETHCPLCYQPLEVREVAPCHACGACPGEIDHFREGKHRYAEYEVFPGLQVVLCNICDIEFSQYDPVYFGLPPKTRVGFPKMRLVRKISAPVVERDKYCPSCRYRLAFLRFVQRARELHHAE